MLSFFSFVTEQIWSPEFITGKLQCSRDLLLNLLLIFFHATKSSLYFQRNADSKTSKRHVENISTFSVSMVTSYPSDLYRCLPHRPINLIMGQISLLSMGGKSGSELFSCTAWKDSLPTALVESQHLLGGPLILVGKKHIIYKFLYILYIKIYNMYLYLSSSSITKTICRLS